LSLFRGLGKFLKMTPPVRIKICGITTAEDGRQAALLGADAIGLNFYVPSPRCITPAEAGAILRALPPFTEPVGLFVNEPWQRMAEVASQCGPLRTFQCHSDLIQPADTVFRLIVAFPVRDRRSLDDITAYLGRCRERGRLPVAVLADAHVPGQYGGTGRTAPWELLADFRPEVPLILAGGLTPDNVAEAVRTVRPYGVDVAGGVESRPGHKDAEKMRRFIDNARSV
jgi:phosphoribosylanthranilate isomerase